MALTPDQQNQIMAIYLELKGGPQYASEMKAGAAATTEFGKSTSFAGTQLGWFTLKARQAEGAAIAAATAIKAASVWTARAVSGSGTIRGIGTVGSTGRLQGSAMASSEWAFANSVNAESAAMGKATKNSWLHNQSLYTLRRYAFFATLAVTALAVEALRMGFRFDQAMNTARVAMQGFLPTTQAINKELNMLYTKAAFTPFQFQDIVIATRRLLPFSHGLRNANMLVDAIVNSLAALGTTSPAYLTRATLALSHMMAIGRLTGQVLYAMGRDNIPMQQALQKHFNKTGAEIKAMITAGMIDAPTAAAALEQFVNHTKGFAGAARRIALGTLTGVWTTFKDIIMKSFGGAEGSMFSGIYKALKRIDMTLMPKFQAGKPITMTDLFGAIDKSVTPGSHLIINTFSLLSGVLKGLVWQLHLLAAIISWPLKLLGLMGNGGKNTAFAMSILGRAISVLIILFGIVKTKELIVAFGMDVLKIKTWAANIAMWAFNLTLTVTNKLFPTLVPWIMRAVVGLWAMAPAAWGAAAPFIAWAAAIAAVITGLILLTKYQKQLAPSGNTYLPNDSSGVNPDRRHHLASLNAQVGSPMAPRLNAWGWLKHAFGAHASGGFTMGSPVVVGEHGPELAYIPTGSRIIPNQSVNAVANTGSGIGGGVEHWQPIQWILDGQVLAEGVAKARQAKQARR